MHGKQPIKLFWNYIHFQFLNPIYFYIYLLPTSNIYVLMSDFAVTSRFVYIFIQFSFRSSRKIIDNYIDMEFCGVYHQNLCLAGVQFYIYVRYGTVRYGTERYGT